MRGRDLTEGLQLWVTLRRAKLMGQRSEQDIKKVGLPGNALQVRVPVAFMVSDGVCLENLAIFDKQFDRLGSPVRGLERGTQNFGRPLAAIHRNQLHSRTDAGLISCRVHDYVIQFAVLININRKTQRIGEVRKLE